jgi:hypothetical protein
LGGRASQRTASVNYSGAHADVAPEFLHKSRSVRVAFADCRAKAHGWDPVCDRRIRNRGGTYSGIVLASFLPARPSQSSESSQFAVSVPVWGLDGTLVDLLYRNQAAWFGNVATLPVVAAKICVDQFGYNPVFAAPFGVLTYEWKNSGISLQPIRDLFTWKHYRDKIIPTLLATWAVWIPLMAIIYSLPLALQFPLFGLALTFWVLLLTYMTNRFAGQIEADAPLALATTEVK